MRYRIEFAGTLREHRLGNHQFAHQVNQLIDFLHRNTDAGGFARFGRCRDALTFTLHCGHRQFGDGGGVNFFHHRFGLGGNSSWRGNGFVSCREADLCFVDDEAEHRHDVIFTDAINADIQRGAAFLYVCQGAEITHLFQHQIDFFFFEIDQLYTQAAGAGRFCAGSGNAGRNINRQTFGL